eukprot:TRINITY_DN19422_c0_g1_i3.p1 TRINITY_DN19422_c0_g1~~TRINITY_DN19422_c0_g1_i3.p1  ORF type:complete len:524 (+),score=69.92 TRINITY_DN19422_c0_g1_i3:203-1774(+)
MGESGWCSETSIRKQIKTGTAPNDRFVGSVMKVSLWQLALMCDAEGKSSKYPGLLELVTGSRRQKGRQRSLQPCSKWIAKNIEFWHSMGPDYQKQLLWEGLRGRLIAGVENKGVIVEAKPKGFARTIVLNNSLHPIDFNKRCSFGNIPHATYELDRWWKKLPKIDQHMDLIHRSVYFWLYRQILVLLLPDISCDEMMVLLIRDWEFDSGRTTTMTKAQFIRSMITIAQINCETNTESECINFMIALHRVVMRFGVPSSNCKDYARFEVSGVEIEDAIASLISSIKMTSHLTTSYDLATVASRCMLLDPSRRDNIIYFKTRLSANTNIETQDTSPSKRSLCIPHCYQTPSSVASRWQKYKKRRPKLGRAALRYHSGGYDHQQQLLKSESEEGFGSPPFISQDSFAVSWQRLSKPLIYSDLEYLQNTDQSAFLPDPIQNGVSEGGSRQSDPCEQKMLFFRTRDDYFNNIPTSAARRQLREQQAVQPLTLPSIQTQPRTDDSSSVPTSVRLSRAPLRPLRTLIPNT